MPPVATTTRACTAPGAPKFLIHRPDVSVMEGLLAAHGLDLTAVVLRLAWQLGLLRSEIHGLSWEQVDFTASGNADFSTAANVVSMKPSWIQSSCMDAFSPKRTITLSSSFLPRTKFVT